MNDHQLNYASNPTVSAPGGRLASASLIIGIIAAGLAVIIQMEVAESLWLQMKFYTALFGSGMMLGLISIFRRHDKSTFLISLAGIAINLVGLICKCWQLLGQIAECSRQGWM